MGTRKASILYGKGSKFSRSCLALFYSCDCCCWLQLESADTPQTSREQSWGEWPENVEDYRNYDFCTSMDIAGSGLPLLVSGYGAICLYPRMDRCGICKILFSIGMACLLFFQVRAHFTNNNG
ncbi:hypothetical protein NXS19_002959 [Fusarium pseudograminearum]|nr:hypothetical protein NXS19_002959 [Fusarium pseudograminearum]